METTETIKIVIPGEPRAQQRHRSALRLRKGRTGYDVKNPRTGEVLKLYRKDDFYIHHYDPSWKDKAEIAKMVMCLDEEEQLQGPLRVDRYYYCRYRQGDYGTGRNAGQLKLSAPFWKDTKPDLDNYDKLIFDVLTARIFKNDSQICAGIGVRVYSESPRTEIYITALDTLDLERRQFEQLKADGSESIKSIQQQSRALPLWTV